MNRVRFLPRHRLRLRADFDRVYERRASVSDARLIVYADENRLSHPRLGLSVSRRVGAATLRNRLRRRLREAFRLNQHDLPAGIDFVIVVRPGSEPSQAELTQSLVVLALRSAARLRKRSTAPETKA